MSTKTQYKWPATFDTAKFDKSYFDDTTSGYQVTEDGNAAIKATQSKTNTGNATIKITGNQKTKSANAEIVLQSQKTSEANARIKISQQKTKDGNSRIKIENNQKNVTGDARIQIQSQKTKTGNASILLRKYYTGNAAVKVLDIEKTKDGDAYIYDCQGDTGDGSDGKLIFTTSTKSYGNLVLDTDYKVSGNYLYLKLDKVYNFSEFTLGSGTELRPWNPSTSGTSLYIKCKGKTTISGTVRSSFEYAYTPVRGQLAQTSWASGETEGTLTTPGVANGGAGGAGGTSPGEFNTGGAGGAQGNGYGGGGGGGDVLCVESPIGFQANGGNGGTGGPSPTVASGGRADIAGSFTSDQRDDNGDAGTNSSGGGGGAGAVLWNSTGTYDFEVDGGNGGNSFIGADGEDGQNGDQVRVDTPSAYDYYAIAGGGGGGCGGAPGYSGINFILKSVILSGSGTVNASGTSGGNGGDGGNGDNYDTGTISSASGGGGGGGGGGGNGGDVVIRCGIDQYSGSYSYSAGSGGLHGNGGLDEGAGSNGSDGSNGSNGSAGSLDRLLRPCKYYKANASIVAHNTVDYTGNAAVKVLDIEKTKDGDAHVVYRYDKDIDGDARIVTREQKNVPGNAKITIDGEEVEVSMVIPETSNFYTGGGETLISIIGCQEIILKDTKKVLTIQVPKEDTTQDLEDSDQFDNQVVDLKRGQQTIELKGWIEDDDSESAWNKAFKLRAMCARGGPLKYLKISDQIYVSAGSQYAFLQDIQFTIKGDEAPGTNTNYGNARVEVLLTFLIGYER